MGRTNERLGERGEGTGLREGKARGGASALCEERAAALDGAVELVEEGIVEHAEEGTLARDEPDRDADGGEAVHKVRGPICSFVEG